MAHNAWVIIISPSRHQLSFQHHHHATSIKHHRVNMALVPRRRNLRPRIWIYFNKTNHIAEVKQQRRWRQCNIFLVYAYWVQCTIRDDNHSLDKVDDSAKHTPPPRVHVQIHDRYTFRNVSCMQQNNNNSNRRVPPSIPVQCSAGQDVMVAGGASVRPSVKYKR